MGWLGVAFQKRTHLDISHTASSDPFTGTTTPTAATMRRHLTAGIHPMAGIRPVRQAAASRLDCDHPFARGSLPAVDNREAVEVSH
jgi:hypothetical protein